MTLSAMPHAPHTAFDAAFGAAPGVARAGAAVAKAHRPRKLVFYTHALTQGGAERVMAMLASGFAERGDHVALAIDYDMLDHGLQLSPLLHVVEMKGTHGSQIKSLGAMLRETQPDCIISALSSSNLKMMLAARNSAMHSRHIMTWHGFPQAERGVISRLGYFMRPIAGRVSAHHVCVSDALLAHMRSHGIPAARSSRIYNPIDLAGLAAPAKAPPLPDAPVILSAGRLAAVKDFPTLLRAFAKLPFPRAHLIILGEGSERKRLELEAAKLGLAGRITMPGHVHDMRAYYEMADVFALPSLSESFSNVVVEALSYGLPVVATDCGGPAEILARGRYGRIVPVGDDLAMAQEIEQALAPDPQAIESRQARASQFGLAQALDAYGALFDSLIAQQTPAVQALSA
ncbi:MAG: glycosyltransferase [Beijerinckiaceae bacterium]